VTEELKVPFGRRADGTIVHITELTEAENGLACQCTCPKCGQRLQARNMGKIRIPHFAHSTQVTCDGAIESALHLFAKEVFARHSAVRVPQETTYVGHHSAIVSEALDVPYTGVAVEQPMGGIIPDVVLERAGGKRPLLVEVAVTHFADEEKCGKLEALGYPCIEIDLQDMVSLEEFDRAAVEEALVTGEDRKIWLYHPNEHEVRADLERQIREAAQERERQQREAEERRRKAEERTRQERERVMSTKYQQMMAERTEKELSANTIWLANKRAFGIPDGMETPWYLNYEVNGEYLWTVHRTVWQSALFRTWVFNKQDRSRFVSVKYALETLQERHPEIWEKSLYWAWKDMGDRVRAPAAVIGEYFKVLAECGFLWAEHATGNPFAWKFVCVKPGIVLLPPEYNSPRYLPIDGGVHDTEVGRNITIRWRQRVPS
jgi:hypothetical protein